MPVALPPNPLPCGCRVKGLLLLPSQENDLHVEFCPLHQAAEDLLTALQMFMRTWNNGDATSGSKRATKTRAEMWKLANAAVLKARPAKEKRAAEENAGA